MSAGVHLHALLTPERVHAIETLRPLRDPARDAVSALDLLDGVLCSRRVAP